MYCDRSVAHFPGDTPISLNDGHDDEVRVGELLEDVGCTGDFKVRMNPSATPAKASVKLVPEFFGPSDFELNPNMGTFGGSS